MELCQDVMVGLSLLKDDSRISKFQVIQLTEQIGKGLLFGGQSNLDNIRDQAELKLVGLAIASVFLEAAKMNKTLNEEISLIEMALNESSVDQAYIKPIVDQYCEIERQLKAQLLKLSIDPSVQSNSLKSLVDVRWRQDVIITSKYRNQINEINYLFDLLMENREKITFSSDLPGLQDLAYQLRDCCNVVENTFKNIN